jgi:SAM-dependent methyltransferase
MTMNAIVDIDMDRLDSAIFAHQYAQSHCQPYAPGQTCAWYHGSWQFLRLLDLVSTPAAHASHFARQLEKMSGDSGFQNILVSGSADSSMVQTIHETLANPNAKIKISVVDICGTPLKICEHYADDVGISIKTMRQDILEGLPQEQFDAIFTHSFMGYFDEENRQRLLLQWAGALRKGGRLITVQRVRENHAGDMVRFEHHEIEAFVARAEKLMQEPGNDDLEKHDVVGMAKAFAENFSNYPVRSAEQLRAMFEIAGFKLHLFEQQATRGTEGVTGPSVPNAAGFYLIVAERI